MIPVTLQPEPEDFNKEVRQKGLKWLEEKGIDPAFAPTKASELPNYWRHSNKQLWEAYSGICAYLAIYFEWGTGASSTDHFIAKSENAGQAYEWSNYRLSCLGSNRNKHKFDDVLDPIGLHPDTFFINFVSGEIYPNPSLNPDEHALAYKTIKRLKLDSAENNKMRAEHYGTYVSRDCKLNFLLSKSPFVYAEIVRQRLTI